MFNLQYNSIMDENIITEKILHTLCDAIGEDALKDFIGRFFVDCKARTESIISAYDRGDFSRVTLEAHTLATSAATYGALELEQICRDIEFAKPTKTESLQHNIIRLEEVSKQSIRALQSYI